MLVLGIALIVILPCSARAGDPFVENPCVQMAGSPPMYRLSFSLINTRFFAPLCRIRVTPIDFNGVPAQPILSCSAPAPFTASVDSTGSAVFEADPCLASWYTLRDFDFVVAQFPALFDAVLSMPDRIHTNQLLYDCSDVTAVDPPTLRTRLMLDPNRPNPFMGSTTITFSIGRPAMTRVRIFDTNGRLVAQPLDGLVPAGAHEVAWNGLDASHRRLAPGIYPYEVRSGSEVRRGRMVLLR